MKITKEVFNNLIQTERNAQDEKWGEQRHSDEKWLTILLEELGEAVLENWGISREFDDAPLTRDVLKINN